MEPAYVLEDPQRKRDLDQIKLLAIFHFVWAGLLLLGIGFLVFHYVIMKTVFTNPEIMKTQPNMPMNAKDIMRVMIGFYIAGGAMIVLASALNVASGVLLLRRKYRVFSIVVAALDCLAVPLGTALGVFSIIVLARESVAAIYQPPDGR